MIIIPISDMIAYRGGIASALPHGFQGSLLRMLFSDAEVCYKCWIFTGPFEEFVKGFEVVGLW